MSTLVAQAEAADAAAFAKLELLCIKANHAHKLVEACGVPTIVRGLGQEQPGAVRRAAAGCLQNLAIHELIVSRYAQPHTSATRSSDAPSSGRCRVHTGLAMAAVRRGQMGGQPSLDTGPRWSVDIDGTHSSAYLSRSSPLLPSPALLVPP